MKQTMLFLLLGLLLAPASQAALTTYTVEQSALDKFARSAGSFSGNAGRYVVHFNFLCFPEFWKLCRYPVASEELRWTLRNPSFRIAGSGVTFRGQLEARYGAVRISEVVSGSVSVTHEPASNALGIRIARIQVPIHVDLGIFGRHRLTTLRLDPGYSLHYPLGTVSFTVLDPSGGSRNILAVADRLRVSFRSGAIDLQAEFRLW